MKKKTQAQKASPGHPRNIHTKEKKDAALKGGATLKALGHPHEGLEEIGKTKLEIRGRAS